MNDRIKSLIRLKASKSLKTEITEITRLPQSGSNRSYYRLITPASSFIAAYNPNRRENDAFTHLSQIFKSKGLPVPDLLEYFPEDHIYFLSDLGNEALFDRIVKEKPKLNSGTVNYLKSAIQTLCSFQIDTASGIDFSKCYPREAFDRQSIYWDLNYFKYNFLNLAYIPYDEQKLEQDFNQLISEINKVSADFFMYRDFQSRNIMIHDNRNYFIDYQGGRKGPLQYDVASFLFQVRADFSWELREQLLQVYLAELKLKRADLVENFQKDFALFIYLRLIQVLGAYGYRGLFEKKSHFLSSIAYAASLLKELPRHYPLRPELPELQKIFKTIVQKYEFKQASDQDRLKISINSFSYKKGGIPVDFSGNGGGHVFDCRALPNPGRLEEMRSFNGMDKIIIEYLEEKPQVKEFLENVYKIVDQSIRNYQERNFKNLMVSFGCTGGQHRSVYCAEKLHQHLKKYSGIIVEVNHQEQKK